MATTKRPPSKSKLRAKLGMALIDAVQKGNIAEVHRQISLGADPSFPHVNGQDSPAMLACDAGRTDILSALIEAGCKLDAGNWIGSTPAMRAALSGSSQCLRLLILAGCSLDLAEPSKLRRASHYAANQGHSECLALLAEAGCDLDSPMRSGATPASLARDHGHVDCALFIQSHLERQALAPFASQAPPSSSPSLRI